ncbi:hypothetical protein [Burkholderia sp. JKS000303]|uniref:hypothetical protein n=1 Tax=Burkholderia sp. JKS000303 TaxID=1938747 RepID=UPI000C01B17D|nr:hypothetical protein [Burkholderia sp. JKS000303]PFH20714.1 hypothetical protein BX604_5127 [Burkholderia sp. JKS000303]
MDSKRKILGLACLSTVLTGCMNLNMSQQSQLTCNGFAQLAQCMEQAHAQGLTAVSIARNNGHVDLTQAWADSEETDQTFVARGSWPTEVRQLDQQIAAILPEAQRIAATGDWAKYPAWKARYVPLMNRYSEVTSAAARQVYINAAPSREWMATHPVSPDALPNANRGTGAGVQQWCEQSSGSVVSMVPCGN